MGEQPASLRLRLHHALSQSWLDVLMPCWKRWSGLAPGYASVFRSAARDMEQLAPGNTSGFRSVPGSLGCPCWSEVGAAAAGDPQEKFAGEMSGGSYRGSDLSPPFEYAPAGAVHLSSGAISS